MLWNTRVLRSCCLLQVRAAGTISPGGVATQFPSPSLLTSAALAAAAASAQAQAQRRTSALMQERGPGDVAIQTSLTSGDPQVAAGGGGSVHTAVGDAPAATTLSSGPGLSTGIRMALAHLPPPR